jgi:hypothetical protein
MPVPKTTVHKDRDFPLGENQIWGAWQIFSVQLITQPERTRRSPDDQFRRRILARDARHHPRSQFWRNIISHTNSQFTPLFVFRAQAAARRGERNDVAAVLDWLGIADFSCHQINPYGRGRRTEPHKISLFALLDRAIQEFMNHPYPHRRRRGPPQPGERPAPRVCVVGKPEKRQHSHQFGSHLENPGSIYLLSFAVFIA